MLTIKIPDSEFWDESKEEFYFVKGKTLKLEHSLISISKWESIWHVPFLDTEKTEEQALSYIKCMSLTEIQDDLILKAISPIKRKEIADYIDDSMTATTIRETKKQTSKSERITSEVVYYWMIKFGIPVEFEKWHFNRLIMLIRVCTEKEKPGKKMSQQDIARSYREINERNKRKWGTKG